MVTLIPIEPLDEAHGMLIVTAFNELFINWGGQSDGDGFGYDYGNGDGDGGGDGYGWDNGDGDGGGGGYGGYIVPPPEEWIVKP
jgi:hypothetical protein